MGLVLTTQREASDEFWIEKAIARSSSEAKEAFGLLVRRHETAVRNLLYQLTRNRAIADELAQDTFLTAWLKLKLLDQPDRFGAWIRRIAYREFLHSARRMRLEQKYRQGWVEEAVHNDQNMDDEIGALLKPCTPLEREIMILQFGFGFTQEEISNDRGLAVGTIKSHVHRAKQKIRSSLDEEVDKTEGVPHVGR